MSGVSGEHATTSYSASSSGRIAHGAVVVITERLAELSDLALPSSLYKETARPPAIVDVLAYLQALLQKDPAAFLARYGSLLQSQELNHFEALRSADFEVDHWLRHYAAQRVAAADQAANPGRLPARVKNRRLAAMRRLAAQGEYFSDDAMRHRAPLLYHQQIGMFNDEEDQRRQQQQAEAEAAAEQPQVEAERLARTEEAESEAEYGTAGPSRGPGRGVGGSCLGAALRQALEAREAPSRGGRTDEDGHATAAAPLSDSTRVTCARGRRLKAGGDDGEQVQEGSPGAPARRVGPSGAGPAAVSGSRHPGGPGAASGSSTDAGVLFSEFLMRQDDEAQLVIRRLREQQEEDEQMSEHDSDDEDDEEDEALEEDGGDGGNDAAAGRAQRHGGAGRGRQGRPSASERAQMRRDFVSEMQSRFLLGQDGEYVDYGAIDADASLDGDWLEEEARDAEEKYFDED